nr:MULTISPECIES: ATP-binding protein [Sorangium]
MASGACGKPDARRRARPVWRAGGGNGAGETRPPRPLPTRHLSYDSRYADLLFEVVTRRYDAQKPLLLSTNKAFADWGQVFPHAACVVTLVDRLVHRAEVIEIEAESYRLKEAKELSATRSKQRRAKKH